MRFSPNCFIFATNTVKKWIFNERFLRMHLEENLWFLFEVNNSLLTETTGLMPNMLESWGHQSHKQLQTQKFKNTFMLVKNVCEKCLWKGQKRLPKLWLSLEETFALPQFLNFAMSEIMFCIHLKRSKFKSF